MWDKDDHVSRWIQGIVAIPLLAWALFAGYFGWITSGGYSARSTGTLLGSAGLPST
jgi:hypothetical protein